LYSVRQHEYFITLQRLKRNRLLCVFTLSLQNNESVVFVHGKSVSSELVRNFNLIVWFIGPKIFIVLSLTESLLADTRQIFCFLFSDLVLWSLAIVLRLVFSCSLEIKVLKLHLLGAGYYELINLMHLEAMIMLVRHFFNDLNHRNFFVLVRITSQ
jgi:hypothetical protein